MEDAGMRDLDTGSPRISERRGYVIPSDYCIPHVDSQRLFLQHWVAMSDKSATTTYQVSLHQRLIP